MSNRILVGIPCLYGEGHTEMAIQSVINEADVLLIDNGASPEVKIVISKYENLVGCYVIHNPENIYVNPAFNQIMYFFLKGSWDKLVIMNSDLIMSSGWSNHINEDIPIPGNGAERKVVTEGTSGEFTCLTRAMVEMGYPIPECIKIWFGDNFIWEVLRGVGYKTVIIPELCANHFHGGSQNVQRLPGISAMIEEDKVQWEQVAKPLMLLRIDELRAKNDVL